MRFKTFTLLLTVGFLGLVFALLLHFGPNGTDYNYHFYPALERWEQGQAIYRDGFYNAPWLLVFLKGLAPMGFQAGQAALMMFTLAVMLKAWRMFMPVGATYEQPWSLAIILFNLHLVDLVLRTQLDGFVLLGLLCMFRGVFAKHPHWLGLGWVLVAIRPTSIVLLFFYTLWLAYRDGYWRQAFVVPLLTMLGSLALFGPDWPWQLVVYVAAGNTPTNDTIWLVSWWHIANYLHLSIIVPIIITLSLLGGSLWAMRWLPNVEQAFVFLTVASLVVTPYALSYHYSTLMAVFVPMLLYRQLWLGLPLYALTLLPVLRLYGHIAWIDMGLPLFVWGVFMLRLYRARWHGWQATILLQNT